MGTSTENSAHVKKFEADFDSLMDLSRDQQVSAMAYFHGCLSHLIEIDKLSPESVTDTFSKSVEYGKRS